MDDALHDYLWLDLENVGVGQLCRLLLYRQIGERKFINSNDDEALNGTFWRRFVIFVCVVVVKGLKSISKLMELLGCLIETSLNLWSHYDRFYLLVYYTLRGKNYQLSRESPDFSSLIGLTDTRLELDDQIHHEDPRYNSALAIMAAKTAYENEARIKKIVQDYWKMEFLGFYSCSNAFETKPIAEKQPTQAYMFSDKTGDHELICVSFRGTSPLSADDWCTDLDLSWFHLNNDIGRAHLGFLKALGLQKSSENYAWWPKEIKQDKKNGTNFAYYKIRQALRENLEKNKDARFIVTGHSLGGALAVLFPAILALHEELELLDRLEGVYTFGQPRVGDYKFCQYMEKLLGVKRYFRFVYANDIVPRLPFDDTDFRYKHFGYCYYFNSFYKGQVVCEEPNKNYFSIKPMGRMYLNAIFEMVRSIGLRYAYGRSYREGILLMGIRIFGLIFPGVSAHCPQDYVNLTRLASPDTFSALQYNCY